MAPTSDGRTSASRRSYRRLASLPAFYLLDADGRLLGSVRAESAAEARRIFRGHLPKHPSFAEGRRVVRADLAR